MRRGVKDGGGKARVWDMCKKYYDFVTVEDNMDDDGDYYAYPYRIQIRTDEIANDLIFDLENEGFECKSGSSCNEWETSLQVRKNKKIQFHPPHMPMTVTTPKDLAVMAPQWNRFLAKVAYLGHLLGTLDNGIHVEKQAFGHCDTSIVLEVYKNAYGEQYKSHQCNECINYELGFKKNIENHNTGDFETGLQKFVTHFKTVHKELFDKMEAGEVEEGSNQHTGNLRGRGNLPHGFLDTWDRVTTSH